jgi:Family of unknown function (DUF5706)
VTAEVDKEKLIHARWVLERNLHWIATSEVKIGVVIAIDTGMLGAMAAALSGPHAVGHEEMSHISTFIATCMIFVSLYCAAMCVLPRTRGPDSSFIFFAKIAAKSPAQFKADFDIADGAALLKDCLDQVHRNAEIALAKFKWVRRSMIWCFGSVFPWALALASLVKA